MSAVVLQLIRCACGARATHRVEHLVPSTRGGLATHHGAPRCRRCAERDASNLLADGVDRVDVPLLRERRRS